MEKIWAKTHQRLSLSKGCDGSVLLDDTPNMVGEKLALSNINSLRSFEVIDEAKEALESVCPGVVSCADIIIMASSDAVMLSGGPNYEVKLGREDSLAANQEDSNAIMPSPRANATMLVDLFARFNLSVKDLVALSGSHSIGLDSLPPLQPVRVGQTRPNYRAQVPRTARQAMPPRWRWKCHGGFGLDAQVI